MAVDRAVNARRRVYTRVGGLLHLIDESILATETNIFAVSRDSLVGLPLDEREAELPTEAKRSITSSSLTRETQVRRLSIRAGPDSHCDAAFGRSGIERRLEGITQTLNGKGGGES